MLTHQQKLKSNPIDLVEVADQTVRQLFDRVASANHVATKDY